jgi:hypothetical protein
VSRTGQTGPMAQRGDDDDWVGTPPEGRHSRDMAKPGAWSRNQPVYIIFFGVLGILVAIVLVLALA